LSFLPQDNPYQSMCWKEILIACEKNLDNFSWNFPNATAFSKEDEAPIHQTCHRPYPKVSSARSQYAI
jgi:hypothetical protein